VRDLARRLKTDYAVAQKIRHGDRSVKMSFTDQEMFSGRPVVLVDDIVSSGGTVIACTKALLAAGSVPHPTNAIELDAIFAGALRNEFMGADGQGRTS
jgi:ribose-phosphate pyrophosphokinase